MEWHPVGQLDSKSFQCGFCGNRVASNSGLHGTAVELRTTFIAGHIYICPHCTNPTYFNRAGGQVPGVLFGAPVAGIEEKELRELYGEARRAYAGGCYTAVILCCRKLIMHVSVAKGAEQGLSFVKYIDFLEANHFVPPGCRQWVDKIREKGNEANHEIVIKTKTEAEEILSLSEMLLKILYEFPSMVK